MSAMPPTPPTLPGLPATFKLEILTRSNLILHRIYWKGQSPLLPATDGKNRYDCPGIVPKANRFGVVYLGYRFDTCWMETVVRNSIVRPAGDPIRMPANKMTDRWACEIHVDGTLTLSNFADESLLRLGESASNIMADTYARTQMWSKLLEAHANPEIDGIHFRSRFKSDEFCIALFDRGVTNGTGNVIVVRYADDIVVGFEQEADARRFWDSMRQRFEKFALELHGDKTRLLEFGRHAAVRRQRRGLGKPETFTFLGFTFICGKSRPGAFLLHRKTRGDRMRARLREIKEQLRRRMHDAIPEQGRWLSAVVTGFFAYHAVPTNSRALGAFRYHVTDLWRRTLRRRSQKDRLTWDRMSKIADYWLPPPRILHPWPNQRFAVNHPR